MEADGEEGRDRNRTGAANHLHIIFSQSGTSGRLEKHMAIGHELSRETRYCRGRAVWKTGVKGTSRANWQ